MYVLAVASAKLAYYTSSICSIYPASAKQFVGNAQLSHDDDEEEDDDEAMHSGSSRESS